MTDSTSKTGLVLTGGGARAAYQVGVLQAVAQIRRDSGAAPGNLFPVIAGTSAGAINAAALACRADTFDALGDIVPWTRSQRLAVRAPITVNHLLASSAIPFVFPAVALDIEGHVEYCGDGSMRQAAPISPAVHLGAERILVVGAGRMHEPPGERPASSEYPNLAQIAGHALSNIFLDALAVDVERLQRINATLALLPPRALAETSLKPIKVLVISPSERLDDIAARHLTSLPLPIRAMLRGL